MKHPLCCVLTIAQILYSTVLSGEIRTEDPDSLDFLKSSQYVSSFPNTEALYPKTPIYTPKEKSPMLAVGLSTIFPGLGHFYLEDVQTASILAGTAGTSYGFSKAPSYEASFRDNCHTIHFTTRLYGVYAAYRDGRMLRGDSGYRYKMPTESFSELAYAPFQISVLKKPEVWGGLLVSLAAATGVAYLSSSSKCSLSIASARPVIAFPIGIGEEAFFRGFVQPSMSEVCTPWGGIAISSALFGAAHIGNASEMSPDMRRRYYAYSIPFITVAGVYFGWMANKNNSLKECVALHAWYDFTLMALQATASQASIGSSEFAISIPF